MGSFVAKGWNLEIEARLLEIYKDRSIQAGEQTG